MYRGWLAVLLLGACGFEATSSGATIDAAPIDSPVIDGPPGSFCAGNPTIRICMGTTPVENRVFGSDVHLDTATSTECSTAVIGADASAFCVIAGASITVNTGVSFSAEGTRPLVFVASGQIAVLGSIDVAGHEEEEPQEAGPGATACGGGTAATQGGGGAGGGLGAPGAAGGGNSNGAIGGMPAPPPSVTMLRGGCHGTDGPGGGKGGRGGGGVALLAAMSIRIDGVINASGGGGEGSENDNRGGGGGGSGGMIVIDSPIVTGAQGAKIYANGGAGGEGSGGNDGRDGEDARPDPTIAALGGAGGSTGGDGGNGSKGDGLAGNAPTPGAPGNNEGGGGGGGGAGVIQLFKATALPGVVSPPPT